VLLCWKYSLLCVFFKPPSDIPANQLVSGRKIHYSKSVFEMSINEDPQLPDRPLSLKELFDNYYTRLVYFSAQIVGSKASAEDIAQEAFIKYWNQRDEIATHQLAIKNYLYNSVKNASLNAIRHQKVKDNYSQSISNVSVTEDNIISTIIHAEVLSELHKAIESLPESCQRISRMGYLDGMKNHEIAEELGISINTVKTQKQRALQLLRLKINPELFSFLLILEL
jgi:RNA polymerase sigma-70 factor (ECF subfamily)